MNLNRARSKFGLALAALLPAAALLWAQPEVDPTPTTLLDRPRTNPVAEFHPLVPGADDARISQLTAKLLERAQYSRHPFDDSVSTNVLARLIKDLDPQRIHFLQDDIREFDRYRLELDDLTLRYGDTTPAYDIFNRFMERMRQRVAYSTELLRTQSFDFTGNERIVLNRKDLPYPRNFEEARQLWRDRVRFDYLQEKLNLPATNAAAAGTNGVARSPEQVHADIVKTLTRRYARTLKLFNEWDSDNVLQLYLDTVARVYDPHSDYMGKAAMDDFSVNMNLSLFGIGAVLTTDEDGFCKIKELKPGPALKDGRIKPNDRIVAVAQGTNEPVDVMDLPLNKTVQLIRGPKGTEVRLTLVPADATDLSVRKVVPLIRDEIKLEDQQAKARLIEVPGARGTTNRLGVIDLPSFYAPIDNPDTGAKAEPHWTSVDVAKLLKKLMQEQVSGVILDLRRNGGGSLEEAIKLTGLFIRRGTVVQVRDPNGIVMTDDDDDPDVLYDGPLVVLTSRYSASASEIVAGALQDYGRALIVGDVATHGKGTVQSLTYLRNFLRGENWITNDPGAIKVTIRKFYRPSGSSTQLKGVVPDIVLPSVNNVAELGESALENPMPWDTIQAALFEPVNRVAPYLEELRRRSAERVAQEKDFAYIREDMDLYKKAQADKTLSLNEAQRLKEKNEADTREKARIKEIAARPSPKETIYDLNLKQAELPGLPPPATNQTQAATSPSDPDGSRVIASNIPSAKSDSQPGEPTKPQASPARAVGHPEISLSHAATVPGAEAATDDDKPPTVDTALDEAESILLDYISLMPHEVVTAAAPARSPADKNLP